MMGVVMRFAVWKQVLDDGTGAGGYANVPRLRPSALAPPLFRYAARPSVVVHKPYRYARFDHHVSLLAQVVVVPGAAA